MTLTQNKKLFQIIIGAVGIAILVIVISILFALRSTNENTKSLAPNTVVPPQPNIEVPQSVQELKNNLISSPLKTNNGDLLLYESDNFYIEYITAPNVIFVKILNDAEKSKKEAQDWFISKGFKQSDLCTISVRFILASTETRIENPNFSSLPDGCSGEPIKKQ